jgi:alanine racemase
MPRPLSWIEIDTESVACNLRKFKGLLSESTKLLAVVKGEAYGHKMIEVARAALKAGSEWLGVFHLGEVAELRKAGIDAPVLILGYVPQEDIKEAVELGARITVSSVETVEAARQTKKPAYLHLKLETGTNRLGLEGEALEKVLSEIQKNGTLVLEGAHTHYANIEDTTEHGYAQRQLTRFTQILEEIRKKGFEVPLPHTACTAAAILFPETYFELVRVGIGMYGLWPSKETYVSALQKGQDPLKLEPAMTWKTIAAQVKEVPAGEYIGYGCTYRTTRKTIIAVLPVGYANGYDRLLSNCGHVLIKGTRAPIRGRVCMNLTMVDVTDIPGVALEDEVVLLGRQGEEQITAEQMASWAQTINYEIVTRADPHAPRKFSP